MPDTYTDRAIPEDDPDSLFTLKQLVRPGRGKWKPYWQEGWVTNQRTGLWVPDVDDPGEYRRRMETLGIEPPQTRAQSTGRPGGGMHLLFDGRDLPEEYWQQGPLGDPCWGDLKCAGFIAAQGAQHPFGPFYDWIPDSGIVIVKPSREYADMIIAERERYRVANKGSGGGATGRRNVSSMTGENRNNRLISLRGALLNLGYDDAEIREHLIAANEQFHTPLLMREMEDTVLRPKPNFVRHSVKRHASIPRLRVAPPDELAAWADGVTDEALAPVTKAIADIRPQAEAAAWDDPMEALDLVEPAAKILGGIGDLDLVDFDAGLAMITRVILPAEYTATLAGGADESLALEQKILGRYQPGWNAGAAMGRRVPEELQPALDAWHPPCLLPREDIEAHRLPPGPGRPWPVQNFVSKSDDRGNARRLADHYGDLIRFADDQSTLSAYAFNGQRWLDGRSGGPGLAGEYADKMIGSLPVTEAMSLSVAVSGFDKEGNPVSDRNSFWSWLNAQQSDAKRASMIRCASTIEGMRVPVSVFDSDTQWLNTLGGEIDLGQAEIGTDGKWRVAEPIVPHPGQHYPEHYHTRCTAAAFDPEAACPEWEAAMRAWLGDDDLIKFLGKLVGASLRGMTTLKVIVLLLGEGDSGRSTFLAVLLSVLDSYAMTAQPSILRKNKGGGTLTDDLADLRGYRLVTTTETSSDAEMDEPRLKRMSGGDRLRARGMWQSSGEWEPMFLLWLATNYVPRLSGEDLALWNRFAPIVFPNLFTKSGKTKDGNPCGTIDPNLKQKLLAEAPGIPLPRAAPRRR